MNKQTWQDTIFLAISLCKKYFQPFRYSFSLRKQLKPRYNYSYEYCEIKSILKASKFYLYFPLKLMRLTLEKAYSELKCADSKK